MPRNNNYNNNAYNRYYNEIEDAREEEEYAAQDEQGVRNITANNVDRIRREGFALVNTTMYNKNRAAPAARRAASRKNRRASRRANRKERKSRKSRANRK